MSRERVKFVVNSCYIRRSVSYISSPPRATKSTISLDFRQHLHIVVCLTVTTNECSGVSMMFQWGGSAI